MIVHFTVTAKKLSALKCRQNQGSMYIKTCLKSMFHCSLSNFPPNNLSVSTNENQDLPLQRCMYYIIGTMLVHRA